MNRVIGGDYSLVRALSAGGMGDVFVAEQRSTGKHRALKLMKPELARDPRFRERFVLEAKIGARIDSEHVVEVVAAGIDEATGSPWLAMELLDGEDFATSIGHRGPLPFGEVVEVFRQLGHALTKAHMAGVVHRDLKPENLFVARPKRDGIPFTIKVLDFGIAKLVSDATSGAAGATGAIGTPLWMSPEQADARAGISSATDIWPLGLIAYFALTARHYWHAATTDAGVTALLKEVLFDPLDAPSVRAVAQGLPPGSLPPGFDAWFFRCVAREPGARFASVREAVEALASLDARELLERQRGEVALLAATLSATPAEASPLAPTQAAPPMLASTPGPVARAAPRVPPAPPAARRPPRRLWPIVVALVAAFIVAPSLFVGLRAYFQKQRIDELRRGTLSKDDIARQKRVDELLEMSSVFSTSIATVIPIDLDEPAVGAEKPLVVATLFCGWDLECARLSKLADELLNTPTVHLRVVYKSAVRRNDKDEQLAAQAALGVYDAAGAAGFLKFRDLVFAHRAEITRKNVVAWANTAGVLDADTFGKRLDENRWSPRIDRHGDQAARIRITGSTMFANCVKVSTNMDIILPLGSAEERLIKWDEARKDSGFSYQRDFEPYQEMCYERERESRQTVSGLFGTLPVLVRSPFASDSSDDAARDAVIHFLAASASRDAKALAPFVADSIKSLGRDIARDKFVSERTSAHVVEPLALVAVELSPTPDRASSTATIEAVVAGLALDPKRKRKAAPVDAGVQAAARVTHQTVHVVRTLAGWQVDLEGERTPLPAATCVGQMNTSIATTSAVAGRLLAPLSRAEQDAGCLVHTLDPWLCSPTYKCLMKVQCHRGTSMSDITGIEFDAASGVLRMGADDTHMEPIAFDPARVAEFRAACSDAGGMPEGN